MIRSLRTAVLLAAVSAPALLFISGGNAQAARPAAGNSTSRTASLPVTRIAITGYKFVPARTTVTVGAQVTWTNQDTDHHNVYSDNDAWSVSPSLGKGNTFSVTFKRPGTYPYHCGFHPFMTGTVVVVAAGNSASHPMSQSVTRVAITGYKFVPARTTVTVGARITWTNQDSDHHNVYSDNDAWSVSPSLGKGDTFSVTFKRPGTYPYHCGFHPFMTGTIVVKGR